MKKYFVYLIYSSKCNRWYTGVTTDLEKRLKKHNDGSTFSTKPYLPWRLVYNEEYGDKTKAYKREFYLKSSKGYLDYQKIKKSLITI